MAELYMLEIDILPCAYVRDVIEGVWRNLQAGLDKSGGKKVHGFKIVGENRLVAIVDGGIEVAMSSVTAAYGDQTKVSCIPLRSYETFAEHVLGVDNKLTTITPQRLGTDGRLFWLRFSIDYVGMKTSDMLGILAREATAVLTLRSQGNMELDAYKVVGQRDIHIFAKLRDGDILDDLLFTLPLMKELGNQTRIVCKSITHLPDLSVSAPQAS